MWRWHKPLFYQDFIVDNSIRHVCELIDFIVTNSIHHVCELIHFRVLQVHYKKFSKGKRKMESLRELALKAVLKDGRWRTERIPRNLILELELIENHIRANMSGCGFFDFNAFECIRFSIEWSSGTWIFTGYGGPWKAWPVLTEPIGQNGRFMSSVWSDVFALSCTESAIHGFFITSYSLQHRRNKVMFRGLYFDRRGNSILFKSEFSFHRTSQKLFVRTLGWIRYRPVAIFSSYREFWQTTDDRWFDSVFEQIEETTTWFENV